MLAVNGMKYCPGCKETKKANTSNFGEDSSRKDGLCLYCKICITLHRKKNAKKLKKYRRRYYEDHIEEAKICNKKYRKDHIEEEKAKDKQYYKDNIKKIKKRQKQYYKDNANAIKKKNHKIYHSDVEESRRKVRESYKKYSAIILARRKKSKKSKYKGYVRDAEKKNRKFELTYKYCCDLFDADCYYCGAKAGTKDNPLNGLDRVDNDKGYTKGNVVTCCIDARQCVSFPNGK